MKTEKITKTGTLYFKHRTKIWGIVWCVIGLFGGNIDRVLSWIPTLRYGTSIEQTPAEYQNIMKKLSKIEKMLDSMQTEGIIKGG